MPCARGSFERWLAVNSSQRRSGSSGAAGHSVVRARAGVRSTAPGSAGSRQARRQIANAVLRLNRRSARRGVVSFALSRRAPAPGRRLRRGSVGGAGHVRPGSRQLTLQARNHTCGT